MLNVTDGHPTASGCSGQFADANESVSQLEHHMHKAPDHPRLTTSEDSDTVRKQSPASLSLL